MRPAKSQRRMPNDIFTFKQFAITQASAAMKVGTDAVMLGAVATLPDSGRVLDIGTGTGIVAIMAAQRRPDVTVTAIEIDPCAADEARANVAATPWSDRIEVVCGDVRTWDGDGRAFDCIVSNPPYYEGMLRGDDHGRNIARHDETLDMATLTATAARLLAGDGTFTVIVPADAEDSLLHSAADNGLAMSRRIDVVTKEGKAPKRIIIEMKRKIDVIRREKIAIRDRHGNYTDEYARLTGDFYKHLN